MARMNDDYERVRKPVKKQVTTGGPSQPVAVSAPVRTGGGLPPVRRPTPTRSTGLPPVAAPKRISAMTQGLNSLAGKAPKAKKKRIKY